MCLFVALLICLLHATSVSRGALALDNLALRQQLATYARSRKRPRLQPGDRAFRVALSWVWQGWHLPLAFVKPATVIDWHRRGLRRCWCWRSRRPGRPRIPDEHIAFIRRISTDRPGWGEDRIAEVPAARCRHRSTMRAAVPAAPGMRPEHGPKGRAQALAIKLGVRHSTSTIQRYMLRRRAPRSGQTWRTFIRNHASQIFACDLFTQPMAFFTIVYIFIVMEIAARRIVLINVTASPRLAWVQQQILQATAWAQRPRFLTHDNDGIFGQFRDRKGTRQEGSQKQRVSRIRRESSQRAIISPSPSGPFPGRYHDTGQVLFWPRRHALVVPLLQIASACCDVAGSQRESREHTESMDASSRFGFLGSTGL
jgi:putative transposase